MKFIFENAYVDQLEDVGESDYNPFHGTVKLKPKDVMLDC